MAQNHDLKLPLTPTASKQTNENAEEPDGPYAHIRHPQYSGFVLIMIGFLLQWPTFATLAMFPLLLVVYRKLAIREEREVAAEFASAWDAYAAGKPRFLPHLRELGTSSRASTS